MRLAIGCVIYIQFDASRQVAIKLMWLLSALDFLPAGKMALRLDPEC